MDYKRINHYKPELVCPLPPQLLQPCILIPLQGAVGRIALGAAAGDVVSDAVGTLHGEHADKLGVVLGRGAPVGNGGVEGLRPRGIRGIVEHLLHELLQVEVTHVVAAPAVVVVVEDSGFECSDIHTSSGRSWAVSAASGSRASVRITQMDVPPVQLLLLMPIPPL